MGREQLRDHGSQCSPDWREGGEHLQVPRATAGCDLHTEAEGSQEFDSRRNKLLSLLGERGWGRKLGLEGPGENKILRRQLALSGSAEQIAEGF